MDILELVKATGGPGVALLVMAYMVKYFMNKLDERDKSQQEVIAKNTLVMERVLFVLEQSAQEKAA